MAATLDINRPLTERITRDGAGIYDGAIRYMMLRPDVLMGMIARLAPDARAAVLRAFAQSAAENGGKSVQAYLAAGAADPLDLLALMVATSADLGWGRWRVEGDLDAGLTVTVHDSPFAACSTQPSEAPLCAPITGILTATAAALWPQGAEVHETHCVAQAPTRPCCTFHLRPKRD